MARFHNNRIGAALQALLLLALVVWGVASEAHASSSLSQSRPADRAEALAAEGVLAFNVGNVAGAKAAFRRALEINNKNVTAHTYLGVIADGAGDLQDAEKHFAAAVAADPASATAHNNYGAILLKLGRTDGAAAEFKASLKLNQRQPSALFNLARIRFSSGTPEGMREARDLFESANRLSPDAETSRALVVIALKLNDAAAASSSYRDYSARLTSAPDGVKATTARAELGSALLEAGLFAEAAEELGAAVEADPANVPVILSLARAHLSRKDIRSAGHTLELAVARGVNSAQVYVALAEVYEASGHVENAIPAMRLAIEQDPKNEDHRFRYAMILTDTKAPGAAIIRLQEALKLFPNSAKLWFALGVAHSANYGTAEAASAFEHALKIDPKCAPALAYLGLIYSEHGRYGEAIALYEKALAGDDRLPAAHYLAADAILKQSAGNAARAEAHLVRALALDSSFSPARLALAKLYARDGRLKEAVSELELLVAAEPGLAEPHYQLGRAYAKLNRRDEANAELEKFKKLSDSEKEQAQNARQQIIRRLANVRF